MRANKAGLKPDGSFDAHIALSPSGADAVFAVDSGADIRAPILMITGTRDDGLGGDYCWRASAFDALPAGHCDRLAFIDGATHMNLAGAFLAGKTKAAVVSLIEGWLDGVRVGQCTPPPRLDGVSITTKNGDCAAAAVITKPELVGTVALDGAAVAAGPSPAATAPFCQRFNQPPMEPGNSGKFPCARSSILPPAAVAINAAASDPGR